jgi:general secretion pathway protein G
MDRSQGGFTLLELLIVMFILVILLSVALPTYQKSIQQAKETVLKENLWQMRRAIDQFATDKGKLPASIAALVGAGYLREAPVDPMLERAEWNEVLGDDPNSTEGAQGLVDVKSVADGEDDTGRSYKDY